MLCNEHDLACGLTQARNVPNRAAVIAAGLAKGLRVGQVLELYVARCEEMFDPLRCAEDALNSSRSRKLP